MNSRTTPFATLLLVIACSVYGGGALAQTITGRISGTVTDSNGAAVPGVSVKIINAATHQVRNATADPNGFYVATNLPVGDYSVTVEHQGFKKATKTGYNLVADGRLSVDFTLETGAVSDTVTITSDAPIMNTETSSVGQVVDNKTVVTLPLNGRNYSQLAALASGATPNPGSRTEDGFSLNGNRLFQNSFQVDGADNNNYIFGVDTNSTQALRPSVDAIQEFKIETANYSAEYGRAAGGVISVAIKSEDP